MDDIVRDDNDDVDDDDDDREFDFDFELFEFVVELEITPDQKSAEDDDELMRDESLPDDKISPVPCGAVPVLRDDDDDDDDDDVR